MLDELAHMEIMVESVLHFLRDGHARAEKVSVDLATSLQTICDQFADTGHDVSYDGPDHAVIRGHPDELQRAITNLVDNAVRHGGKARCSPQPRRDDGDGRCRGRGSGNSRC